jgi:hypothetical protein
VDPSRGGKDDDYRRGYRQGRADTRAQKAAVSRAGKRRRSGCALALLMLPWLLLRHRAHDQPDRHDQHPDRLGGHEPTGFSDHLTPAAELLARLNHPTDTTTEES